MIPISNIKWNEFRWKRFWKALEAFSLVWFFCQLCFLLVIISKLKSIYWKQMYDFLMWFSTCFFFFFFHIYSYQSRLKLYIKKNKHPSCLFYSVKIPGVRMQYAFLMYIQVILHNRWRWKKKIFFLQFFVFVVIVVT